MVLDVKVKPETVFNLECGFVWPRRYVFLYERAYQEADTAIQSSVMTKVKGYGKPNNRVMDVADYVYPPQVCITKLHI